MFTMNVFSCTSSFYIIRPLLFVLQKAKIKNDKSSFFFFVVVSFDRKTIFSVCSGSENKGKTAFEKILHYENLNLKMRCLLTTLKLGEK